MKNPFVLFLLFLLIIFSCEKADEDFHKSVAGVWYQDPSVIEGSDMAYRNEMKLNKNGTYERSIQIVKINNVQNVIGYLSLTTGEYQINNKKLKLVNIEHYGLDNESEYLDREDLVHQSSIAELPEIELGLDKSGDVLTLFYPCLDYASCIPSATFYRSK